MEQGKKLAEWNRKNNKKSTLEAPVQELAQDVFAYKYWILGGALAIIGVLYFTNREFVPQQVQEPLPKRIQKVPTPPTSDPFAID